MNLARGADDVVAGGGPRRRPHLRARAIDGELVILDRQRQLVHQLNQTASHIWRCCDGQHGVAAIVRDLTRTFEVEPEAAARDVAEALRQLEDAGLIEMPAD